MDDPWRVLFRELGLRADEDLLPSLVAAASVTPADVRRELSEAGLAWHDPAAGMEPSREQLGVTAQRLMRRSSRRATLRGALGGMVGAAAIPPEVLAALVQSLRLAQRLAVVYGVEPDTDHGRIIVWRALAAAWQIELPTQGALGIKLSDLPALVVQRLPARSSATADLARTLALRAAVSVGARASRMVPGLGSGIAALQARRTQRQQGERMQRVFEREWDAGRFDDADIQEAVEV